MTENEFILIVAQTKKVVLAAIARNLYPRFAHAIDDVAQETYMRAYKHLTGDKFRAESEISTWIYTIARNESLRMNKKMLREEQKMDKQKQQTREGPVNDLPWWEMDYDKDLLYRMIDLLPENFQKVLRLVAQGYSVQDISKELAIAQGTVKSRTSRAKNLIREKYQEMLEKDILKTGKEYETVTQQ